MSIERSRDIRAITACNRAAWNASATQHRESPEWRRLVEGFAVSGFSTLDATLTAHLQGLPVAGRSAVQVGCNNGRELLSLGALGAHGLLGIDQSEAFLAQAAELSGVVHRDAAFVCADVYALPPNVPRDFELALVTIGVLNWMPDLPGFFEAVAALLAPGGTLVVSETHPMLEMFEPGSADPLELRESYFRNRPQVSEEAIVYDGTEAPIAGTSYWFPHTVGDVLNATIAAGLAIERFTEYPHSNREVDYAVYEGREAQLPMCYLLRAGKPG